MVELVDDVGLRPAELTRKRQETRRGELLRAKHQHLRGEECIPDLPERRADFVGFRAKRAELSQLHP
jgi:hypothetical protein